jgi:hypothetical protein
MLRRVELGAGRAADGVDDVLPTKDAARAAELHEIIGKHLERLVVAAAARPEAFSKRSSNARSWCMRDALVYR